MAGIHTRAIAAFAALIAMAGCASPGPPLPPTLNLPQVVSAAGLTAMRVGDEVRLHWTTPTHTTDKLTIKGPITAEICRDGFGGSPARGAATTPCNAVTRVEVTTGPSDAVDSLPASLTVGPARILRYRVQLRNAAGRTAGPSAAAFAAAGQVPGPVEGFAGGVTKAGVVLRWKADAGGAGGSARTVELDRTTLDIADAAAGAERKNGLPGGPKQTSQTRFQAGAGAGDAGGTVDRTAEIGHSYSYTAQSVNLVDVGGQALELRSVPTAALAFTVRDEFPPDVPAGLVAVPSFAGKGETARPTIDLSWEPDVEARLAGYRVYRREVGSGTGVWVRIATELVTTAAYRDMTVAAGHRYAYRVSAVSTAGNESAQSGEAVETAR